MTMDEKIAQERQRRGDVDWNDVRERRVWRSIEAARTRPAKVGLPWPKLAALSVGMAAAGAIGGFVWFDATQGLVSVTKQQEAVSSQPQSPFAPQVIALQDGSVATVRRGDVEVVSDDHDGAAFRQRWGNATYEVAPQKRRRVRVLLPDAIIEVVGTVFRVEVDKASDAFSVHVLEGVVLVQRAGEVARLTVGERYEHPARELELHASEEREDDSTISQMIEEIAVDASPRRPRRTKRSNKADGENVAEKFPLTTAELFAQADDARRRGQSGQAIAALDQILATSQKPSARATAHFTLAKLYRPKGQTLRAAKHFLKAYRVHPQGPVGEDALAEAIVLLGQLPDRGSQLVKLIETYETHFANGTHKKRVLAVKAQLFSP